MHIARKSHAHRPAPLAALAALGLAAALPQAAHAQQTYAYTVIDPGTLGGTYSIGNAINAAGQARGTRTSITAPSTLSWTPEASCPTSTA